MFKTFNRIIFSLSIVFLLLGSNTAFANDRMSYEFGEVDKNKVWSIEFTGNIDVEDINSSTVTLIDEFRNITKLKLKKGNKDNEALIIPPEGGYKEGENEIIIPQRLMNDKGESLNKNYSLKFSIHKDIKIKNVVKENEPFIEGNEMNLILSSNTDENVRYSVVARDFNGKVHDLTDGYTDIVKGNSFKKIELQGLKSGNYDMTVYMKIEGKNDYHREGNIYYTTKSESMMYVSKADSKYDILNEDIKFDGNYIKIGDIYYLSSEASLKKPQIGNGDNQMFEVYTSNIDRGTDSEKLCDYDGELDWNPQKSYEHLLKLNIKAKDGAYIGSKAIMIKTKNVKIEYEDYNMTVEEFADKLIANGQNIIDGGNNRKVRATRDQVIYYLNPENFMDAYGIYQFMNLNYVDGMSVEEVDEIVSGKGILDGRGAAILEGAKKYDINPAYLIAHIILETGHGRSTLARGVSVNGKTVYNMYGIQATDANAIKYGSRYAYNEGWFTPDSAIIEGAKWVGDNYINSEKFHQNTLYKMRWNKDIMWHQYSTDVRWAYMQIKRMEEYLKDNSKLDIVLEIPRYKK